MDKTDVILCQLLLMNSRLSYRRLADMLNLSVAAVHSRIQSLIDAGVIRKFTAKISFAALKAVHVILFGASKYGLVRDLNVKMANHGSIYWLAIGGGNMLYIGAYLKSIDELGSLVNYVKEAAGVIEPTVGIPYFPFPKPVVAGSCNMTLYDLDYKIIRALKDNSRRTISEVADELGVSAKTIRRRLSRMIRLGLIELSIEWYPDASNDIITIFHIHLKPEADKNVMDGIFKKYTPYIMFYWGFSNIPNFYVAFAWTSTMKELQTLRESLENESVIRSLSPNILYTGYIFKTWRDQLL